MDHGSCSHQLKEEDDEEEAVAHHCSQQLPERDVLLSLACGEAPQPRKRRRRRRREEGEGTGPAFECRTCGRRFASHQALGGHRTSHFRPTSIKRRPSPAKGVAHACGVCGMGFDMGQALGGHMRRHRPVKTNMGLNPITISEIRPNSTLQLLDLFV